MKLQLESKLDKEEVLWKQRAKIQWLVEGDRNTNFFHSQATARARKNEIHGLVDDLGHWCEDEAVMGAACE